MLARASLNASMEEQVSPFAVSTTKVFSPRERPECMSNACATDDPWHGSRQKLRVGFREAD
jgi:hypothetical protein